MKWHWVEGWQELAAAPWYGPGQEAYASACYVLGIAMHFPAQTIIFFQARLDYGIGLLLLLYVIHQRDFVIKYIRDMDKKHFFLTESMCVDLFFPQYEEVLRWFCYYCLICVVELCLVLLDKRSVLNGLLESNYQL